VIGHGNGTFDTACTTALGEGPAELVAADFDLDGTDDLAIANDASETVSIVMIMHGCSFNTDTNLSVERPRAIVAGLFDDNLYPDLAVGTLDSSKASGPSRATGTDM